MTRIRIIAAALATLALAAPAASADPHATDTHNRAEQAKQDARAELQARGRDGVQTGSLAGTTEATARAYEQELAYSTKGNPAVAGLAGEQPASSAGQQVAGPEDDGTPWALIAFGIAAAALVGVGVTVTARRSRVAT
jgi:hypothetical protein